MAFVCVCVCVACDTCVPSALMIAANKGKTDEVKFLVAHGANVNAITNGGCTALMFAAEKGYLDIVDILLINSAEVNLASSKVHHCFFFVLCSPWFTWR